MPTRDFTHTPDEEVVRLLAASHKTVTASTRDEEVQVHAGSVTVNGRLTVPDGATAIVVFAHRFQASVASPMRRTRKKTPSASWNRLPSSAISVIHGRDHLRNCSTRQVAESRVSSKKSGTFSAVS
jgi:hypothetical protein